jgi:hypothetical protein
MYKFKKNIDAYIDGNELNSKIYQILLYLRDYKDDKHCKLKRKPLEIFNQVYAICEEIQSIKHPEEIVGATWKRTRSKFLPCETSIIFSCVYIILYFTEHSNPNIKYFLNRIILKIDPICFQRFEPLLKDEVNYMATLSENFEFLKAEADKISDLNQRELFYIDSLTHCKQVQNEGNILQQISDEISLIQRKKELSGIENQVREIAEECDSDTACIKIRSVVILELLKKLQLGTAHNDLTKICKLIAFLTGSSYHKIYNELQKGICFSKFHNKQIDDINKILKELNASISIDKSVSY